MKAHIFAGVNGAGKTTLYYNELEQKKDFGRRINIDEIVSSFGDWKNQKDQIRASKIAINLRNIYSPLQNVFLCSSSALRISSRRVSAISITCSSFSSIFSISFHPPRNGFLHTVPACAKSYTFRCLRVVVKLPRKPIPTPSVIATGTNVRNTVSTGRNFIRLLRKLNFSIIYTISRLYMT